MANEENAVAGEVKSGTTAQGGAGSRRMPKLLALQIHGWDWRFVPEDDCAPTKSESNAER